MADAIPVTCLNCGFLASGRFCAECGQRTDVRVPTVRLLAREALEAFFSLDSKLWRTLRSLFLRPGELAAEYMAGRRAGYVPPIQLYLWLQAIVLFAFGTFESTPAQSHRDRAFVLEGLILAGLFRVWFAGRGRPGALHFVFALHVTSFVLFLSLADSFFLRAVLPALRIARTPALSQAGFAVVAVTMFAYTCLGVRRAYGEGAWTAIAKTVGAVLTLWLVDSVISRF